MTVQMISYDLRKPGRNYDELYNAIKAIGTWWHCLESVWLVKTNSSSGDVRTHLQQFIDANDDLVVFGLNGNWATYGLSDECNNWLRNNLAA